MPEMTPAAPIKREGPKQSMNPPKTAKLSRTSTNLVILPTDPHVNLIPTTLGQALATKMRGLAQQMVTLSRVLTIYDKIRVKIDSCRGGGICPRCQPKFSDSEVSALTIVKQNLEQEIPSLDQRSVDRKGGAHDLQELD